VPELKPYGEESHNGFKCGFFRDLKSAIPKRSFPDTWKSMNPDPIPGFFHFGKCHGFLPLMAE
jgi:hypothetical protein